MSVTDVWDFAQHTAIVYNTSVADSLSVALYYASERGIPAANLIGFAMGTGNAWAYDAARMANLWVPLRNHLLGIGAQCVLAAAGCPNQWIGKSSGDGVTDKPLHLVSLLSAAKRIVNRNTEVRVNDLGSGNNIAWDVAGSQSLFDANPSGPWITGGADSRYQSAVTTSGQAINPDRVFRKFATGWQTSSWAAQDVLPCGLIGWQTYPDTTHPVDLFDKSKAIIRRGVQNEVPLATAKGKKILVGIDNLDSTYTPAAAAALMVPELAARGFTNVTYWYDSSVAADPTSLLLAPSAGAAAWDNTDLDAETVTPFTYWMGFGYAFANSKYSTWNGQLDADKATSLCAGQSDISEWVRQVQADGGIGGLGSPRDCAHLTTVTAGVQYDVMCALLDGRSLAEAMMLTYPGRHVAVGDPLMRPVRV